MKSKAFDAKLRSLNDENERLNKELESVNHLKNQLIALNDEKARICVENETLQASNSEMQRKISALQEQNRIFEQEITSINSDHQGNSDVEEHLKRQLIAAQSELISARTEKKSLLDEKQDIEYELQTLWTTEAALKRQLAESEGKQ